MTSTTPMRFTYLARKVMAWACHHAQRTNSQYIHPEHLARGIAQERQCSAAQLLVNVGIDLDDLKKELELLFIPGGPTQAPKDLIRTPATQSVIDAAREEATELHHDFLGTEHYLLGFLRNPELPASQLLVRRGLDLNRVRLEVKKWDPQYERTNSLRLQIKEILLSDWDPHSIANRPEAHGSYDSYVDPLLKLIESNAGEDDFVQFLRDREAETMCFPSLGTRRLVPVARKLIQLRNSA